MCRLMYNLLLYNLGQSLLGAQKKMNLTSTAAYATVATNSLDFAALLETELVGYHLRSRKRVLLEKLQLKC